MLNSLQKFFTAALIFTVSCAISACQTSQSGTAANAPANASPDRYKWVKVTDKAAFKEGYNYPLYCIKNKLWAFHPEEIFSSADGKSWTKANLPSVRHDAYEAKYVQFGDAVYALGKNSGNYLDIKFNPRVSRTTDLEKWEVLSDSSNLPGRIFYGAIAFDNKLWLLGGFDGKNYYNDVWNSADGVRWTRVLEKAPWSERNIDGLVVFAGKMWIISGGKIDSPAANDVWSSPDGINWTRATEKIAEQPVSGFASVAYDGKLWLLGINRNNTFVNATLISADGKTWQEQPADWTPRGGVGACVMDNKLYLTGGKYSVTENGQIRFIYSNDVWYMTPEGK
jgi:hypothetical protein